MGSPAETPWLSTVGYGHTVGRRSRQSRPAAGRRGPDHFSRQARRTGYPARSVFKLVEIDRRFAVLRPGDSVLDLGAAPGSWSLYCLKRVGPRGSVTAIDRVPLPDTLRQAMLNQPLEYYQADITVEMELASLLAERTFRAVLSDAAPNTTGNALVDGTRSHKLVDAVCGIAGRHLAPGGVMIAKLLQAEDLSALLDHWRPEFASLRTAKPAASRVESREVFIVGRR